MSKKLLLIASTCLLFGAIGFQSQAQNKPNLFSLPDTVCADHEFSPFNVISNQESYNWTLCPPNMASVSEGSNTGPLPIVGTPEYVVMARENEKSYSFFLNQNGVLYLLTYEDGYENAATETTPLATINGAKGMYAVQQNNKWHLFVTKNGNAGFELTRFDFTNGLQFPPAQQDLGAIGNNVNQVKRLYIAQEEQNWYGFTFSQNDELIRLNFGTNLLGTPSIDNLGNINNQFSGVSDITGIYELGNWHVFVTNSVSQTVNRISFGNSLSNTPFVINLGNMGGRLKVPSGITISTACDAYYGYVTNKGSASMVLLKWEDLSIASNPIPENMGNVASFQQPTSLSNIAEENGTVFLFSGNANGSISKILFKSCTNANVASSTLSHPIISYNQPGNYPLYLTVNRGLANEMTDCKYITITPHAPVTVSNDTMICQYDTLDLTILTYGADSFSWSPNYNISSLSSTNVKVWPTNTQQYIATAYFAPNCIVKSKINVTVSEIRSDAGPDRVISDGSTTILGGANTTLGSQYTYLWHPNIGFVGSTGTPVTSVLPPYNLTYYLTVTNTDGCVSTDSVLVQTPCDKINLPNAFIPSSSNTNANTFGVSNLQLAKVNYFKIFDRWGKEVFSTNDPNVKWDGKVDGKMANMGVYIWEIDANCANTGERFRQSGSVTLIK